MPKAKKAARSSTPAKPGTSASAKPAATQNKSAFVRSLPPTLSAKEVVSKAKAEGMTLTENYVYTIRSAANLKKKGGGKPGRPAAAAPVTRAASASNGSLESRFVDLALDLGLANAEKLLAKLRASIKNVTLS